MAQPGPANSLIDVAGLQIGCAHDAAAATGVTVIVPDAPAICAVDVRGGGPGTRETDALEPQNLVHTVDALTLSGGSVYGLAAADAVAAAMGAAGKGFRLAVREGVPPSPIVPAAILYDLANGGNKAWGETPPYASLARAAYAGRGKDVPLGNAGAGYGAGAGGLKGGQGSASIVSKDGVTVAALACVNSFGSVVIPGSRAFWAWQLEQNDEFGGVRPQTNAGDLDLDAWGYSRLDALARANTTLIVVATDAALTRVELKRVAQMAGAGMARAIRPIFGPSDGDVVFALSTGVGPLDEPRTLPLVRIGALAADCVARAIARGVYAAESIDGRTAWRDWAP